MALLAAYAVPHPPLIVPAVGHGQEAAIADTIAAYREVARRVAAHRPDLIVITSPHAPLYRDGFFIADTPEETGSLAAFGQPDERVTTRTDLPFAEDVAARLHRRSIPSAGAPASMADIDHGTFVPLHFLEETINLDSVTVVRMGLSGLSEADHRFLGRAITEAARALGRRCVLVASGDMSHKLKEDGPYGFAPEGPKFDRTVAVDLKGVWNCMRYEIIQMLKQGGGAIVNTSSQGGVTGFPGQAAYIACKHAVIGLTRTAAIDYSAKGIRINAVCPGVIRTPMAEELIRRNLDLEKELVRDIPAGRLGKPEEIADAVLWLCSPQASFVDGHALLVDGAFSIH